MNIIRRFQVILLMVFTLGISIQVYAGNPEKKGTAGAEELLIPIGAKATALAGSPLASISGIDAMYWNPAGVANTSSPVEALFSYMKYIADINLSYGALAVKTGFGTIGFSFQTLAFGDIPLTTEDAPNGNGSMFSPTFMTLGINYSRAMTDRIYVGVNAKLISEKIVETKANGFALDMGVQYLTSYGIRLGVVMKNFGTPMQFSGLNLERDVSMPSDEPGTPTHRLSIPSSKAELPSSFEIGLAYDFNVMENTGLTLSGNFRNNNFLNNQLCIGAEADIDGRLFIRGGYDYAVNEGKDILGGDTYLFGPTFGFGLKQALTGNVSFDFDFAYRSVSQYFDSDMIFTAKLLF